LHGEGKLINPKGRGDVFEGVFVNGVAEGGPGQYQSRDSKSIFEGTWKNGHP
jgi:hypothetical protein